MPTRVHAPQTGGTMNFILEKHLVPISCDRSMPSFLATPTSAPAGWRELCHRKYWKSRAVLRWARVYTVVAAKPSLLLTKTQLGFRELQTVWEIREVVLRRSRKWAILTNKLGHSSFKPSSFVIPCEILDDFCIVKQNKKKKSAIQCGTAPTEAMFPHFLWTAVLPSRFSRS